MVKFESIKLQSKDGHGQSPKETAFNKVMSKIEAVLGRPALWPALKGATYASRETGPEHVGSRTTL